MNTTDLNHFKDKLEKEEKTLVAELKKVSRKNPSNPNDWEAMPEKMDTLRADRNEVADKIGSFEGDIAILKELEPHLNDVKAAIAKIKNDTYGVCEICQKPIEIGRLEANPAAKTCKTHLNEKV